MNSHTFWKNKKVLVTGNTGFKGSWLSMFLVNNGANVFGYSLEAPTKPSLFEICKLNEIVQYHQGDIRDYPRLQKCFNEIRPDIIFHMAAQPLVGASYEEPIYTYETNVMGTVNLLDCFRRSDHSKVLINITTDKVYKNNEWCWSYREDDKLGGHDPYSNSKACSELVTSCYRESFLGNSGKKISTVRAGNVIGGGDWANNRIIPDCLRSLITKEPLWLRKPHAIRPWQHVLDPLYGYLALAEKMYEDPEWNGPHSWNFSSDESEAKEVKWIVDHLLKFWGAHSTKVILEEQEKFHEAQFLKLDSSRAKMLLGWKPHWNLETSLKKIIDWTKAYVAGENMREQTFKQIDEYLFTRK